MSKVVNLSAAVRNRRDADPVVDRITDADLAAEHAAYIAAMRPWLDLSLFPTPPWATRALIRHALPCDELAGRTIWEPACGLGHMADVLAEARPDVILDSDVHDYEAINAGVINFIHDFAASAEIPPLLARMLPGGRPDWIITNPPFPAALDFALRGLAVAKRGVALLCRTNFVEGKERWERLFRNAPPTIFAPFAGRVDMTVGGIDPETSSATSYSWFVWMRDANGALPPQPPLWIPYDAEQELTLPSDRRLVERRVPGWKPASHWRKARAATTAGAQS